MTRAQSAIYTEYLDREEKAGGLAYVDPQQICNDIAADWNVSIETVVSAVEAAQIGAMGIG